MKKSVLALCVASLAASGSAFSATVYEKDGTELNIGGRVQAVYYSNKNGSGENGYGVTQSGNNDSTIVNSARFSIEGRTELREGIYGFAFTEWDATDSTSENNNNGNDKFKVREQFVGIDFTDYGQILFGRAYDAVKAVIEPTDIFEDYGCWGQPGCDDRRSGTFRYIFDNDTFYFSASLQTAVNGAPVGGADDDEMDIDSGFALSAGYTTPEFGIGALAFKVGYSYLKGQDDHGDHHSDVKDMKEWAASVTWGNLDEGLYLGVLFNQRKFKYRYDEDEETSPERTLKGVEAVANYAFESGVSLAAGYQYQHGEDKSGEDSEKAIVRKVPVYLNYNFNENFNVWTEALFDAGSSKDEPDSAIYSVGARYSF